MNIPGGSRTIKKIKFAAVIIAVILALSTAGYACGDCDDPTVIDGLEAYERSQREGRDAVEGFWGMYLDWNPQPGTNRSYRLAIVKNTYGAFPDADYLGVSTCDSPGCKRGEVKLLLKATDAPDRFDATLLVSGGDGGRGPALLMRADGSDRENSAIDLSQVKYQGKTMAKWMLRIKGG
jgi:hypothetical protein